RGWISQRTSALPTWRCQAPFGPISWSTSPLIHASTVSVVHQPAAARRHHQADPTSRGADRGELAAAARRVGCPPRFAPLLVGALAERGLLRRDGARFALPEHAPAVDEARQQRRAALMAELAAQLFAPPPLDEAARRAGLDHQEVNALVTSGDVVVAGGVAFGRGVVAEAVRRLSALGPRFTTAEAREALATTRKYAIPLLEHLDAIGVTEFDGQTRALRRPVDHGASHG
ncbi:MAG TPA: SelB C-terminal domain-containing protein, partial [Nitriliruptorales bacterium]|nr:SelB C-terminal domain-containing protein [Nitriliruptorales bacterium]